LEIKLTCKIIAEIFPNDFEVIINAVNSSMLKNMLFYVLGQHSFPTTTCDSGEKWKRGRKDRDVWFYRKQ
jgi:hypothetical protein